MAASGPSLKKIGAEKKDSSQCAYEKRKSKSQSIHQIPVRAVHAPHHSGRIALASAACGGGIAWGYFTALIARSRNVVRHQSNAAAI
jgi:hypothetical protein